jgi:hypothetical protein
MRRDGDDPDSSSASAISHRSRIRRHAEVFSKMSLMPAIRPRRAFMPRPIAGSTYSRYATGDLVTHPYDTPALATLDVIRRIEGAAGPTYSYIYVPFVDQAEHAHGVYSDAARSALIDAEKALSRLADRLPSGARIVVSADHGQVDVPDEVMHHLDDANPLLDLLVVPPSGDPRIPMFHVRDGRRSAFEGLFRGRYGERFALLTPNELAFFSAPHCGERIGDYVAIRVRRRCAPAGLNPADSRGLRARVRIR